jgi:hypothetical protein
MPSQIEPSALFHRAILISVTAAISFMNLRGCNDEVDEWNARACEMISAKCGESHKEIIDHICNFIPQNTGGDGGGCGYRSPGWSEPYYRCKLECYEKESCETLYGLYFGANRKNLSEIYQNDQLYNVYMCEAAVCQNCAVFQSFCEDRGLCTRSGDLCISTDNEHCSWSNACKYHGKCTLAGGECSVVTDSDCQKSNECSYNQMCRALNGVCVGVSASPDSGAGKDTMKYDSGSNGRDGG